MAVLQSPHSIAAGLQCVVEASVQPAVSTILP